MMNSPVDIALVRMPYSEIGQPSLALGLLKACSERQELSTRVLPANLWFAEELGPSIHDIIFESYSSTLVGEWTFAGALFPDFHPDDEAYLRKVLHIFRLDSSAQWRQLHERYPYLDYVALLREVRRRLSNGRRRVLVSSEDRRLHVDVPAALRVAGVAATTGSAARHRHDDRRRELRRRHGGVLRAVSFLISSSRAKPTGSSADVETTCTPTTRCCRSCPRRLRPANRRRGGD